MKKYFKALFLFSFLCLASGLPALEGAGLWRHPEIAGKNSVFVDVGPAPLVFEGLEFNVLPVTVRADYLPPLPLPVSAGIFFDTPYPNFKHFGLRLAYHFGLPDPLADFYFAWSFDLGFLRNGVLEEYNDAPVEARYYDFRIGARRFFGLWLGLAVETGFKFESVIFMLSIKIN